MKVLNPNNLNHEIKFIPRLYIDAIVLQLKNEETKVLSSLNLTASNSKGFLTINFPFVFKNNENYQFKIVSNLNEIIYRGKIFVTDQSETTQSYKLTKDLFRI